MDDKAVISHLEALADTLGVRIRYELIEGDTTFPEGGFCRVKDQQLIIINARATLGEKIVVLIKALKRFDLSRVYLKPALRELFEDRIENELNH